ncbi:MAG: hypothetical protein K5678_03810 [Acetatifactor sp.]|nr:hypothetical protein [Acetatifactor sp.]
MKNQYVGDVGDFGKYALLRAFCKASVKVGVNWYLTENDGSNDGKFTSYLNDESMLYRCPEVFQVLSPIADEADKSVNDIERSGILPNAIFYGAMLKPEGTPTERVNARTEWFAESEKVLGGADLIFMDPDNGLLEKGDASALGAEKYVLPDEVEAYFKAGHDVVYYCHKGRRTLDAWQDYKSVMFERMPDAKPAVLTYHKGSQRSYIFLIHAKSFVKYRRIIDQFMRGWHRIFSEEFTNKPDPAFEKIGPSFTLTKSDGSTVTLENRADGQVALKYSKRPNETIVMEADLICSCLGI